MPNNMLVPMTLEELKDCVSGLSALSSDYDFTGNEEFIGRVRTLREKLHDHVDVLEPPPVTKESLTNPTMWDALTPLLNKKE